MLLFAILAEPDERFLLCGSADARVISMIRKLRLFLQPVNKRLLVNHSKAFYFVYA